MVGCIKAVVQRQYPVLYMEKKGEDIFLVRTAAQEEHAQRIFEVIISYLFYSYLYFIYIHFFQSRRNKLLAQKTMELQKQQDEEERENRRRSTGISLLSF